MADKSSPINIDNPYRTADYDFGVLYGSATQKPSWVDGLPHDFHGWGPQTPDPDAKPSDVGFQPEDSLNWVGEGEESSHHVWHFDGRRRHHH